MVRLLKPILKAVFILIGCKAQDSGHRVQDARHKALDTSSQGSDLESDLKHDCMIARLNDCTIE